MTEPAGPDKTLARASATDLAGELGRRMRGRLRTWGAAAVIPVLLLLFAAPFRFIGVNWDSSQHLHPDERFITMVSTGIELPRNLAEYFDTARSPLNPYNRNFGSYVYGTLPLFFVRGVAEAIQGFARAVPVEAAGPLSELWPHLRNLAHYGNINLLGRVLSGVADLLTLVLVYLCGRRLGGPVLGAVAAALGALSVLQIQAAHFFTAESPLVLFTTLAFFLALRVAQGNSWTDWILFGVACGLAVSSKLTAGLVVVLVAAVAWLLWAGRGAGLPRAAGTSGREPPDRDAPSRITLEEVATGLLVAGAAGFLTFRIAQPYAFAGPGFFDMLPNPKYLADLNNWQQIATGQADYPPSHQWTNTTPYVWQLENMFLWGLGPPFALAAWAGLGLAVACFLRDRTRYALYLLPIAWVSVNFLYWGPQFAKPMRYLLPIYPQLAILAAFALIAWWRWARARGSGSGGTVWRVLAVAGPAVVFGWSLFYATAFAGIYARPTTRVEASLWMYEHLPAGARIAWEHWDDPLPLNLPGQPGSSQFTGIQLPLYHDDNTEKREQLTTMLDDAQYIVLSSNRLYGSIPKLPLRYPMTVRYYEALFSGELGFQQVAEFTSRPSLLGIELNDDHAEEIFTVYEHPKVTIFAKGPGYSSSNTRAILGSVSQENALRGLKPIHARTGGLLLDEVEREAHRWQTTWARVFDRDSAANRLPVLSWYLGLFMLGLLAFPLVAVLCGDLADRGYGVSRILTLVLLGYVPWVLGSLRILPFDLPSLWITVGALAIGSAFVLWRRGSEILGFVRRELGVLIFYEVLFLLVFLVFLGIRAANPDLWHPAFGGEKPMDFAYLNAVMRSAWFPAYDPWLAGGQINYYYFGFVIVGAFIKLTGILPGVAYNLALPSLAALTACAAACVVYNLLLPASSRGSGSASFRSAATLGADVESARTTVARRRRQAWALGGSVLAAVLAVFSGNLHGLVQLVDWLNRAGGEPLHSLIPGLGGLVGAARGMLVVPLAWVSGSSLPPFQFDFWAPTRVITTEPVTPITEFPFFTFLYGDLHAHMIAMPVTLAVLAVAVQLVRRPLLLPGYSVRSANTLVGWLRQVATEPFVRTLIVLGVLLGVLRMTNTWDYPTYLLIVAGAILLAQRQQIPGPAAQWRVIGTLTAAVLSVSLVAAAPFAARYAQFYTGIELNRPHTPLVHYLTILGAFLSLLTAYLTIRLVAARALVIGATTGALAVWSGAATSSLVADSGSTRTRTPRGLMPLLGAVALLVAALLLAAGLPAVGISLALVILAAPFMLGPAPTTTRFGLLVAGMALALTAGVELVVLKGDIGRTNTVFKFYLQAWLLFAVAGAVLITPMLRWTLARWPSLSRARRLMAFFLTGLLAAGLIYPLLGTPARLQHRFANLGSGLDGMAYMEHARYQDNGRDLALADDYRAINWLLDNVEGSPTIVEGTAPLYHWGARVSIYTGLPTVVGWDWHQKQQRGDFAYMVDDRTRDVASIYNTTSIETALNLLRRYGVEYVYVGGLERAFYSAEGLQKFDAMSPRGLLPIYRDGAVTIYQLRA